MKHIIVTLMVVLVGGPVWAQTECPSGGDPTVHTLTGCAVATVQACHDHANVLDGETVNFPATSCDATWTSGLTLTKGITLAGAGVGTTIIRDNTSGNTPLIRWTCTDGQHHELSDIEFIGVRTTGTGNGAIRILCTSATDTTVRIGNNKFDHLGSSGDWALRPRSMRGVIDNNEFLYDATNTAIYAYGDGWDAGDADFGDASWAAGYTWGDEHWTFLEDNTFTKTNTGTRPVLDGIRGPRVVARFNELKKGVSGAGGFFEMHGTRGRQRGFLAMEIYKNKIDSDHNFIVNPRSGSVIVWGHDGSAGGVGGTDVSTVNLNNGSTQAANMDIMRAIAYHGGTWSNASTNDSADGTSPWDIQGTTDFSGTVDSASPLSVTVSPSPGWTTNEWDNYIIRKTSACTASSTESCHSTVSSNTADSIMYSSNGSFNTNNLTFAAGETFELIDFTHAWDGIGRTGGPDFNGQAPMGTPTLPMGWPPNTQTLSSAYEWLNTNVDPPSTDMDLAPDPSCAGCTENVHYFNDVPTGTRASRAACSVEGQAHWSTDSGEWWTANAGADGELDRCNASLVWVNGWYTPYTYPHPLAGGATPPPPAGNGGTLRFRIVERLNNWLVWAISTAASWYEVDWGSGFFSIGATPEMALPAWPSGVETGNVRACNDGGCGPAQRLEFTIDAPLPSPPGPIDPASFDVEVR